MNFIWPALHIVLVNYGLTLYKSKTFFSYMNSGKVHTSNVLLTMPIPHGRGHLITNYEPNVGHLKIFVVWGLGILTNQAVQKHKCPAVAPEVGVAVSILSVHGPLQQKMIPPNMPASTSTWHLFSRETKR